MKIVEGGRGDGTEAPAPASSTEDPESQPFKGKGSRKPQQGLPGGVFEQAKTYPKLEEKMGELSAAMQEYAAAGKVCHDKRTEIEAFMKDNGIPIYEAFELCVELDNSPKLKVSRIKAEANAN